MLGGRLFEAPPKLIDRSIELRFHPEAPLEVEIFHDGLSYGMATVLDARVNARVRRDSAAPQPPAPGRDAVAPAPTSSPEVKGGQLFGGRWIHDEMEIF